MKWIGVNLEIKGGMIGKNIGSDPNVERSSLLRGELCIGGEEKWTFSKKIKSGHSHQNKDFRRSENQFD